MRYQVYAMIFVWITCSAFSVTAADDLFSVSPGSVDNPDIACSSSIPIAKQKITITARVRGGGAHPVPVRFVLRKDDSTSVKLNGRPKKNAAADRAAKAGKYVDYQVTWVPDKPGMYSLTVHVDPNNTKLDPVRSNNTASVTIPVVWRELHIIPWGQTRHLKWTTAMAQEFPRNRSDLPALDYWHHRGVKVLGYMYNVERNLMKKSEQYFPSLVVKMAGKYKAAGVDGLIIDETGSYGTPDGFEFIRRFGKAYGVVRKKYPQLKVYNWIAGPLHRRELENGLRNDHILLGECYEAIHARRGPTWRSRLEGYIRKLGPRNMIALGVGGDCGRSYRPQIESSVRMIRELQPDMPGICYYQAPYLKKGESYAGSLLEFLDRLTLDYFIKPVLTIERERPVEEWEVKDKGGPTKPGDSVALRTVIRNIGGMPARNVKVKFFARHIESGRRRLISSVAIPQIGNGTRDIVEAQPKSTTERVLDGVRHPMGRIGNISRVVLDRALVDAKWTPKRAGAYLIETELQPSAQHTVLKGLTEQRLKVFADPATALSAVTELAVTKDDIWVSSYTPAVGERVAVQVRIHNVGKRKAENVVVKVYARSYHKNKRTLLKKVVIGKIGTDYPVFKEEKVVSADHKIIDGTKYPTARWGKNTRVFFTRALADATWTPQVAGYWRIEVDIQPSNGYVIRPGLSKAVRTIPVMDRKAARPSR